MDSKTEAAAQHIDRISRAMAADRVYVGAARLDSVWPGWRAQIDLDRLNMLDGRDCVLGQLVRALGIEVEECDCADGECTSANPCGAHVYRTGRAALDLDSEGAVDHGFDRRWTDTLSYDMLTTAWHTAITAGQ